MNIAMPFVVWSGLEAGWGNVKVPTISVREQFELFDQVFSLKSACPHEELKRLRIARNETIFFSGEPPSGMYVVVEGVVKISKISADGQEKVIDILKRGDSLGEASLFLGIPCNVTAQAVVDSVVLYLPEKVVSGLIKDSPALVRRLLGLMSRRIHCLILDIESLNFKGGHERVADFILAQLPASAENAEDMAIRLPLKKIDLASRLDLTPQHFSRILQDLRKKGLIAVDGQVVHVPSVERLRNGRMKFG